VILFAVLVVWLYKARQKRITDAIAHGQATEEPILEKHSVEGQHYEKALCELEAQDVQPLDLPAERDTFELDSTAMIAKVGND
jgi:hypothetical protein